MHWDIKINQVLQLLGVYMLYSCTAIFSKSASMHPFMSLKYLLYVGGLVGVLGIYAILWQQLIKRIKISNAYIFKGTTLLFALLISFFMFGETITWTNVIGAAIIIGGITLFSMS